MRPLTLNAGMLRLQGDLGILRISFTEPITGTTSSSTGVGLTIGAGYGVSDQIEVGGSYGLSLKDFEAKGPLTLYGAYRRDGRPALGRRPWIVHLQPERGDSRTSGSARTSGTGSATSSP